MGINMDTLKRMHDAARANGTTSREFQQFQIKMYEAFPTIYDIAVKLTDSNNAMQKKMELMDEVLELLQTSKGNIESLRAACKCTTYDVWLEGVDGLIAKVGMPT
jgi:predicted  nucleic acid-binding Zn-ribbon protein